MIAQSGSGWKDKQENYLIRALPKAARHSTNLKQWEKVEDYLSPSDRGLPKEK